MQYRSRSPPPAFSRFAIAIAAHRVAETHVSRLIRTDSAEKEDIK